MPRGLSNSWQVAEVRCSLEIGLCETGGGSGSRVSGRVSGRGSGAVTLREPQAEFPVQVRQDCCNSWLALHVVTCMPRLLALLCIL